MAMAKGSGDAEMRDGDVVVDVGLSDRTKILWKRWDDNEGENKALDEVENNMFNVLERDLEKRKEREELNDAERKRYGEDMQKIEDMRK